MKSFHFPRFMCFCFVVASVLFITGTSRAQIPTFQDCLGAIPICSGTYSTPAVITGTGAIPNEINPANSCLLTGERNDAWYIITTSTAGSLSFTIVPNNALHNYDWAVYNLTGAVCSDIFNNPSLEVACNYSNIAGNTGPNGLPGAQNSPVIPVNNGETYLINVSGFSAIQQSGYTIDLTASSAMITDNTNPAISSITAMNCGASTVNLSFSERVLCNTVSTSDFTLTGPGGPYTVTSVNGNACQQNADYSRDFSIGFTPAITQSGNYTITLVNPVTDLCGNTTTIPQAFFFTISPINISFQKVDVTCFGGNNGSATAIVTGPAGPYSYQWSPSGGSSASAQWLTAGTYTVTVTSGPGCSASASVTINQPLTGLTANVNTTPANGCAANGTASVTVGNGQPPYTYSWWPAGGNGSSANNLTAGSYMVTITDANQCVLNYFFNIPSANGPTANISNFDNVSCHGGNDGSATVSVTGATGNFSYQWSPSGGNGPAATNLTAGNYSVAVTIAAGCTLTATVSITEPPSALEAIPVVTHTSCGNANGSIQVPTSGGVLPYSYQWIPNISSSSSATNLGAGVYTVTVIDANGCTDSHTLTVNATTQPVLTLTNHNDVSCFGIADGSTGVHISGGTLPLSVLWSNGATTTSINNIPAGNYTVTVTDAAGCTATLSDVIAQPSELTASIQSIQHISCFGELTGNAMIQSSGGSGGNSWSWTNHPSTAPSLSNVGAGTYVATVTDLHGCSASVQVIIQQPLAGIAIHETVTPTSCGKNDGSVSLNVSGGTSPYQYSWSNGSTATGLNNLAAGIYTVTVTDASGCSLSENYSVSSSNAPVLTVLNISHANCFGDDNGSASMGVSGGIAPYSWQWQGNVSASSSASGLSAGTYNVTVTDNDGCAGFVQVTITEPSQVNIQLSYQDTICIGSNATLNVNATGGSAPYSYLWSNGNTQAQQTVQPLTTSSYVLTVTDSRGCNVTSDPAVVNVRQPLQITANYPATVCKGDQANIMLNVTGGDGNYNYTWSNGLQGSSATISVMSDTSFSVLVGDGCSSPRVNQFINITALTPPEINFSLNHREGCQPFTTAFNLPAGSGSQYNYLWDFGDMYTSSVPEPVHTYLHPGIYDVKLTVTHASMTGCVKVINFPALINVFAKPTARFAYSPSVITINHPDVFFTDISTGASSWQWNFGTGGDSSTDQHPRYTYKDTGLYVVTLKVTSNHGCTDSIIDIIHVTDEFQVFFPNAFTPDQSGTNDYFDIYGVGFSSYEITIFDRYGKTVHQSKNGRHAWDGKDENGKPLPQGVYVYKVTITDNQGHLHQRFNYVTLIR